ncbi:hypothetical protein [Spirosoma validum]|uniref:Uncharacterized protein n=1 Tax=Spirosoma validum TaxID=2771355 RepID=A0A927B4A6_9BACT|nr:hypothetical protein [Spirosoma validum]MBD2755374.1 hypothetical protein [Spirosoma validum]
MKLSHFAYNKLLAVGSFFAWFTLLTVGITINSGIYLGRMTRDCGSLQDFLIVMLAYTPTNVALLVVLAGLSGGLTSNLAADNYFRYIDRTKLDPTSPDFQRLLYMTESPIVSALRGFLVYMIFIVGANLSITSEGDTVTTIFNMAQKIDDRAAPALYYRFSLTISLLAFLVGFDPSRLGNWINSVPVVGSKPGASMPKS